MQKRIAVISYHTCPLSDHAGKEIGGMNIYVFELSKKLSEKGFKVDIFTRVEDKKAKVIVQVNKNLRVIHIDSGVEQKISKRKLIHHIQQFLQNFYKFLDQEKLQYDYISCHYYMSGIIGMEMQKKFKLPLFMTFHTLGLMKNLVARNEEEQEDIIRIKTEMKLVKCATKVFAISKTDAQYIQTLYDCPLEKLAVLSPGVDVSFFQPTSNTKARQAIELNSDDKVILFVGRVEPLKGIDVLIYAVKILLEKNPKLNLCLQIVGGDTSQPIEYWSKELKKLENLRKILGVTTSVNFAGYKPREDLPNYFNAADIVVMPSHYESFGITVLEAMACGTPVITTDVAGVSEIFNDETEQLITSANNPIMLAQKINDLLTNKAEYERLSKEVLNSAQKYSWDNIADKFIKILVTIKQV